MKKLIIARRISQGAFLFLFIYILWSATYPLKGAVSPTIIFQADPLVMVFTSISERVMLKGLIFTLIMASATLLLGRFFCGWICPLGTIIDGVGALGKKDKKRVLKDATNAKIRKFKYVVISVIATAALFGTQLAWIFDPLVIFARFISLNMIPTATLLINKSFVFLIKNLGLYGGFYDFYRGLKESFLGVKVYYFANAAPIFAFFVIVTLSALFLDRAWCRTACPLGAFYGLISKFSLLRRVVDKCTHCNICKNNCRMGAIKEDAGYVKSECILCMDCAYDCPEHLTRFAFSPARMKTEARHSNRIDTGGVTRRNFLLFAASSVFLTGIRWQKGFRQGAASKGLVIRPPGAQDRDRLLDRCIRCGNCMKVCPTNVLQPSIIEEGLEGLWTPRLVPEIGYCEYNCTLCGDVCPTGAISKLTLEVKQKTKLGTAKVNRDTCIAWAEGQECIVCEEYCPIPEKAIKLEEEIVGGKTILKPVVDSSLCIGCGVCQNKCPVRPKRAIRVYPLR